ncbi:MaoC family dehydratase N-terminal domain-containing protein [Natrialba sp. PRR66]|uniref:MaoC family dehydratase N-terminal domain-containing protein n=1 Tax=Natrialba sp. PRR66 TaxID=3098146 RepID=UPI002B1E28B1|nr:MaoC family dehydratase N-terminal domain-containing protein [Natrialba sp. PRR66]
MPSKSLTELEEQVGRTVTTVEDFVVEPGKVEEFARAIKDNNPVFRDESAARDQGYEAIPAPLTFTRTAYFPRNRPDGVDLDHGFDLGFDQSRVVHGEQEYVYERPLYAGDVLSGETTLVDVYERTGSRGGTMTFAVLETVYRDDDGEHVLTERLTRIELAEKGGDDD